MGGAKKRVRAKRWNVLVYLAGDNNLSEEMVWSLQEMKKAASARRVANALDLRTLFDARGQRPRRYDLIKGERHPEGSGDGTLETLAAPKSADASLPRFIGRGVREMPPASRLAVVLSGHGSGAVGDFLPDEEPASAISIPVLGGMLRKAAELRGSKIDLLGMDSCQMSSIEVAFEAEDSVQYLVASEGLVLNAGWPYHRVLEALAAPSRLAVSAARAVAAAYLAFYRDYELVGLSTDIAVTDLSRLSPLEDAVRELSALLRGVLAKLAPDGIEEAIELDELRRIESDVEADFARSVRDAVVLAHQSAQSYKCDRYTDLGDFVTQLLRFGRGWSQEPRALPIVEAGARLRDAIDEAVVLSGTTGAEFQHSRGLSIYFPWSPADYLPEYRNLRFHERTKWADFLETYLGATARMRRHQGECVKRHAKGTARDHKGRIVAAAPPRRSPVVPDVSARDVDAGTHRDVDAGTHRGKSCRSTMKNPPQGYYDDPAR
jgi:hypothetical protein